MKFLTIMAVVLVYRNWFGGNPVRDAFSTDWWFSAVRENIGAGNLRYLVAVIVPAVAILLVSDVIDSWFLASGPLDSNIIVCYRSYRPGRSD